MKKLLLAAAIALAPSVAGAACSQTAVPPAIETALNGVCMNYLTCDRGGAEVEKACASCQALRQKKLEIELANRACASQTVPEAHKKQIDDALAATKAK